ncbi:protein kinase domain-containing protein [Citrus sinensis]|nr:protein kinase domain-containing protein [Citrus sinensis]
MGEPSEETLPGVTTFFPFIYCYEESEPKDLAILLPDLEPAGVDLLQGQGSAASDYAHQKKKKMHVVSHANYFLDFINLMWSDSVIYNVPLGVILLLICGRENFQYSALEVKGEDEFGGVYRCKDTDTDETVLLKTVFIRDSSECVPSSILTKISLLKVMEHPHILRLLDVVNEENRKHVYQVFECAGPDLKTVIKKFPGKIKNPKIVKVLLNQILRGISLYHSIKCIHGRLNPHQVLINMSNYTVKLADVGMKVAPSYKAPEILLGFPTYSFSADVWSVGCIFAEMVIQKPLIDGTTEFHERSSIFRLMGTPSEETLPGVTTFFKFLDCYAKSEPKDLATQLPGLEPAGIDLLQKMLRMDPKERITVNDALEHYYFGDLPYAGFYDPLMLEKVLYPWLSQRSHF